MLIQRPIVHILHINDKSAPVKDGIRRRRFLGESPNVCLTSFPDFEKEVDRVLKQLQQSNFLEDLEEFSTFEGPSEEELFCPNPN